MPRTTEEKRDAIMRVLYDMYVLAGALKMLDAWQRKPADSDLGEEQIALNAALVKARSLFDFFCVKPVRDDITADQLLPVRLRKPTREELDFRESINKWCAHMTWERVTHAKSLMPPRRRQARQFGTRLLHDAKPFVEECLKRGYKLNKAGKYAWKRFNAIYSR